MVRAILFVDPTSKLHLYIAHGYTEPEKYGVSIRALTPKINKRGYGFSVRSRGATYRGYITTRGDFVIRLPAKVE